MQLFVVIGLLFLEGVKYQNILLHKH